MDALTLLTADHNRVRGLFERFKSAHEAGDTSAMDLLAQKIFTELEVHTTIEEDTFYPWVRDLSEDIAETVDEGLQEHHVVDILMNECKELVAGSDDWVAKLTVLIENVEHHADEEEEDMFPSIRSNSSADQREEMGQRLEARKAELGAPTLADKIDLTKTELDQLAREQEIPGRSSMDHDELAATVAPE